MHADSTPGSDHVKLLFDFLPILAFFATFKCAPYFSAEITRAIAIEPELVGIVAATAVLIAMSVAQVAFLKATGRAVSRPALFSTALVIVFGALTIFLRRPEFIMAKPTILYWLFALVLLVARLRGKNLLRELMQKVPAPDAAWERVLCFTIAFLAALGAANLAVAAFCSMDAWVDFKLFGLLGLTLAYALGLGFYLARYMENER